MYRTIPAMLTEPAHGSANRFQDGRSPTPRWLSILFLLTCGGLSMTSSTATAAEPDAKPARELTFLPLEDNGRCQTVLTVAENEVAMPFRLPAEPFPYRSQWEYDQARVRKYLITFPSPMKTEIEVNNTVHAEYFQPAGSEKKPAVVVLHILGGDFLLSRTIANHLAQNGIAALFVKMPYYGPRRDPKSPRRMIAKDPYETVTGMTQAVLDIRRAAAWLQQRPEVDSQRMGITGISLGGIMSTLGASAEPRFRNVGIVLGGGNFASFLWTAPLREAREFRERWLQMGHTQAEFFEVLEKIDPVTHGPRLHGRRMLMVLARNDEVIPPANGLALWEALNKEPELVWLNAGHYSAIYYLPREIVRLEQFFRRSTTGSCPADLPVK